MAIKINHMLPKRLTGQQCLDYQKDGYVLIRNFCSSEEVGRLYKVAVEDEAMKKNALYDDPATQLHLTNSVFQLVFNTHLALIDATNKEKPGSISGYVSVDDAGKATRLLENVTKGRIPSDSVKLKLIEILTLNPYDEGFYQHWVKTYGDEDGGLEEIENHFGVCVST